MSPSNCAAKGPGSGIKRPEVLKRDQKVVAAKRWLTAKISNYQHNATQRTERVVSGQRLKIWAWVEVADWSSSETTAEYCAGVDCAVQPEKRRTRQMQRSVCRWFEKAWSSPPANSAAPVKWIPEFARASRVKVQGQPWWDPGQQLAIHLEHAVNQ